MAFDVAGARAAGYSDEEIAGFLGEQNKFDSAAALKSGYTPAEIIDHLSSAKPAPEPSVLDRIGAGMNAVRDYMTGADTPPKRESVLQDVKPGLPLGENYDAGALTALSNLPRGQQNFSAPSMTEAKKPLIAMRDDGVISRAADLVGAQVDSYAAGLGLKAGDALSALGADGAGQLLRNKGLNLQDRADAAQASVAANADGAFEKYAPQVLSVFPTMAVAAASGGLPVLFGISEVQAYAEGRKAGLDPLQALGRAVPMGAAEVIGEKLGGTGKLLDALETATVRGLSADSLKNLGGRFLAAGAREVPSEEATYAMQFGIDKAPGIGLRQDATLDDFIEGAKDTAIVAAGAGGLMAGGGAALSATARPEPTYDPEALMREKGFLADEAPAPIVAPRVEDMPTTPVVPKVQPRTNPAAQNVVENIAGLLGEQAPTTDAGTAPTVEAPTVQPPAPGVLGQADAAATEPVPDATQPPAAPAADAAPTAVASQAAPTVDNQGVQTVEVSNPAPAIPRAADPRQAALAQVEAGLQAAKARQEAEANAQAATAQAEQEKAAAADLAKRSVGSAYQQTSATPTPQPGAVPSLPEGPAQPNATSAYRATASAPATPTGVATSDAPQAATPTVTWDPATEAKLKAASESPMGQSMVKMAMTRWSKNQDLTDDKTYPEPVLYGIINSPDVGPELLGAARQELGRRRGTNTLPTVSTSATFSGTTSLGVGGQAQRAGSQQPTVTGTEPSNPVGQVQQPGPIDVAAAPAVGGNPTAPSSRGLVLAPKTPIKRFYQVRDGLHAQKPGVKVVLSRQPLNEDQQVASAFAKAIGGTFTLVENEGTGDMPNGFVDGYAGRNYYVDAKSTHAPLIVTVHEGVHGLPEHIRAPLIKALNDMAPARAKSEFLNRYGYGKLAASDKAEEVGAYMAQLSAQRPGFWEELRTKMGNKDFSALASHILNKFKELAGLLRDKQDDTFLDRHFNQGEIATMRGLVTDAYTKAMREQGMQPDESLVGGPIASNKPVDFNDPEERLTVSTAQPTAKPDRKTGYQPNSYTENRVIDGEDIRASKTHVEKIVDALRKYNSLSGKGGGTELMQELHQVVVDNLLWLHDHVTPEMQKRAKLWYDGANKIATDWTTKFGINLRQTGGVLAVFSPQMDWFKNVSLAERALTILHDHGNEKWSDGMTRWAESWLNASSTVETRDSRSPLVQRMRDLAASGKTLSEMGPEEAALFIRAFDEAYFPRSYRLVTPEGGFGDYVTKGAEAESETNGAEEDQQPAAGDNASITWGGFGTIEKAVKIYRDGSFRTVDAELGGEHKVRNFYNNIVAPNSADGHVTIDTHAVAAAFIKALSGNSEEVKHNLGGLGQTAATGASGSYALFADAYRDAAAQRGILAREMQSITWEAVRSLFPASLKKGLSTGVSAIWDRVKAGEISREEARAQVLQMSREAGGDKPFAWANSGAGDFAADGALSFEPAVAANPADREVRTLAPVSARDKMQVSISASTETIKWVKKLYKMAQKGNELAHAQLQEVAFKGLKEVLGKNATVSFDPVTGLYGGQSEPSLAVTLSFKEENRDVVLAALKQFADNFNQEQIHVRQRTDQQAGYNGYGDGSYSTPVFRWDLRAALDRKAIQKIIDQSGLYGLTFGDGFVEAYYVGDPTNAQSITDFEQGAARVTASLGANATKGSTANARLWAYGRGDGGIGWPGVNGVNSAGQAPAIPFSNKPSDGLGGVYEERGPGARAHAVRVNGTHFSQGQRTSLDGRYFGRGLKGAEQSRLAEATDPRIKERVYFYVDEGKGVTPEAGVGGYAHAASVDNLYNVQGDPLKLFKAGDINGSESRVLDAGFDGYYFPNYVNGQGIAIVMGNASRGIKVQPTEYAKASAPAAPAQPYKRGLSSKELNTIDMAAVQEAAPSAKLRAGTFQVDEAELDAARAELTKQGIDLPPAVQFSNKAQDLDRDIELTIPVEGGKTAKLTVNAKTYINQLDAREQALRMVKECMG